MSVMPFSPFGPRGPVKARERLFKSAAHAGPARLHRMRQSAVAHHKLAKLLVEQAKAQRKLAALIRREATSHVVLSTRAAQGAGRQVRPGSAGSLSKWGRQHRQQAELGRREASAHLQIAKRSEARAAWHKAISQLLWRSSLTPGSKP